LNEFTELTHVDFIMLHQTRRHDVIIILDITELRSHSSDVALRQSDYCRN